MLLKLKRNGSLWRQVGCGFVCVALVSLHTHATAQQNEPVQRQPGLWQQTQTLLAIDTPQASASLRAAARASVGRPVVSEQICLKASDVARDTLLTRLMATMPTASGYRWIQLELQETRLRATASSPRGEVSVQGTLSPILTDVTVTSTMVDPTIGQARRVHRTAVVRIGPC